MKIIFFNNSNTANNNNNSYVHKFKSLFNISIFLCMIFSFFIMTYDFYTVNNESLNYSSLEYYKPVIAEISNKDYVIQSYEETNENYTISIYYPFTVYESLNNSITQLINDIVKDFKTNISSKDIYYSLSINFEYYIYNNIISIPFYTVRDFHGAHLEYLIHTVNYSIDEEKILTADDLFQDKLVFNDISSYVYTELLKNQNIKNNNFDYMLKEGTKPTISNYRNFIVTENGIKFLFERYQVAPYYLGEFSVLVPYEKWK